MSTDAMIRAVAAAQVAVADDDFAEARNLLSTAIDLAEPEVAVGLRVYLVSLGPESDDEAAELSKLASDGTLALAVHDLTTAEECLHQLAVRGSAWAIEMRAFMRHRSGPDGGTGLERFAALDRDWLTDLAACGNPLAVYLLAQFARELGDAEVAVRYFSLLGWLGHEQSQVAIRAILEEQGVEWDGPQPATSVEDLEFVPRRDTRLERPFLNLRGSELAGVRFAGAPLDNADLSNANCVGADFSSADLYGASFEGADVSGANFAGAQLASAYIWPFCAPWGLTEQPILSDVKAIRTDFSGANLQGALIERADLTEAVLRDADLECAILEGANLEGADLSGANLSDAELIDVSLRGANLTGVDLGSLDLDGLDLTGATMPDGTIHD
jgi:uncharacterized protein YjbI with pentapeptide repeats